MPPRALTVPSFPAPVPAASPAERPDIYFSAFGPDPSWPVRARDVVSPEAQPRGLIMTRSYATLRAEALARYPGGVAPGGVSVDDIVQLKAQNT